jgi:hypothetical protein
MPYRRPVRHPIGRTDYPALDKLMAELPGWLLQFFLTGDDDDDNDPTCRRFWATVVHLPPWPTAAFPRDALTQLWSVHRDAVLAEARRRKIPRSEVFAVMLFDTREISDHRHPDNVAARYPQKGE